MPKKKSKDRRGTSAEAKKSIRSQPPNGRPVSGRKTSKAANPARRRRNAAFARKALPKKVKRKEIIPPKKLKRQKAAATRKKVAAKKPNREYIITVVTSNAKYPRKKPKQWDLFVIGPYRNERQPGNVELIRWTVWYIENHNETEGLQYIANLMQYPETKILVARGQLVKKPRSVRKR